MALTNLNRNKQFAIAALLFACIAFFSVSFTGRSAKTSEYAILTNWYVEQVDSTIAELTKIEKFLSINKNNLKNKAELKTLFENTRHQYKKTEFYIEYNYSYDAQLINGPLVPEVEGDDLKSEPLHLPEGFQLAESFIYGPQNASTDSLKNIFTRVKNNLENVKNAVQQSEIDPGVFFQSLRLENERILLFNITGFDNSFSKKGIEESVYGIEGVQEAISLLYKSKRIERSGLENELMEQLIKTKEYLFAHTAFDSFNRMEYIRSHYLPLSELFSKVQQELEIPDAVIEMGYNVKAGNIFADNALNKHFFITYPSAEFTSLQTTLGQLLFFDPLLSGNNERACASCHRPTAAFAGITQKDFSFNHESKLKRNTPSLVNAVFQHRFFYDSRSRSLEEQIEDVLANEDELHTNITEASAKLNESNEYKLLFKEAFKTDSLTQITGEEIKKCLVAYELSLTSLNSNFDKYIRGDSAALTPDEINGFNLFAGKAKCATCHYIPLFNGAVPPFYRETESEVIGTLEKFDTLHPVISPDSGKYLHTNIPFQIHSFKIPGLRNVSLTAPYMHNGGFNSLEEVMAFYNKGGAAGMGLPIKTQTLDASGLGLTAKEMNDIILFLKTLEDTTSLTAAPTRLPAFENNQQRNNRKIGGHY